MKCTAAQIESPYFTRGHTGHTMLESDILFDERASKLRELMLITTIQERLGIHTSRSQLRTNITLDVGHIAQLVVVYNIGEDSDFTNLSVDVNALTEFKEHISPQLSTTVNLAAKLLTDKYNIEMIYTSLLSNILHVPDKLRERPN